jgi:hypothetical protein
MQKLGRIVYWNQPDINNIFQLRTESKLNLRQNFSSILACISHMPIGEKLCQKHGL